VTTLGSLIISQYFLDLRTLQIDHPVGSKPVRMIS